MRQLTFGFSLAVTVALVLTVPFRAFCSPRAGAESAKTKVTVSAKDDVITKKYLNRTAVGERFRLWLSVNATDCNDPALLGNIGKDDHAFELYGELSVNDKVEWKVSPITNGAALPVLVHRDLPSSSEVDPRTQGFSLNSNASVFMDKHEIKADTSKSRMAYIKVRLFDKDDPTQFEYKPAESRQVDRRDDLIGDYKIDLDLGALGTGDGHYYWFWQGKDESGNAVGTNLYLYAEHVGTVYGSASNRLPIPRVDPRVIDKKFPGGSGPVIKKPVLKEDPRFKSKRPPVIVKAKPTPEPTPAPTPAQVAKGRTVSIQSRFVVTNSDDGVGDSIVELVGSISFNGIPVFSFDGRKAEVGSEFLSQRPIRSSFYYDGSGSFTSVRGVIEDHDKASGNDTLWVANQKINLEQILNSHNEFCIKGDRNSESGDLYIRVTDLGEFYEN